MIKLCDKCDGVIEDGDAVECRIRTVYHLLPSTIHYALDQNALEVVGPLCHVNCKEEGD